MKLVRYFTIIALFALFVFSFFLPVSVRAQTTGGTASDASAAVVNGAYAPVKLDNRKLFDVLGGSGLTAAERADKYTPASGQSDFAHQRRAAVFRRMICRRKTTRPPLFRSVATQVMIVTDADAQDALSTRIAFGGKVGRERWREAVIDARTAHSNPLTGAGILIRNSFSDLIAVRSAVDPTSCWRDCADTYSSGRLARLNKRHAAKFLISHARFDANLRQLFIALTYYGTWTVGILAILSTLGLESGSIATTLGISGFVSRLRLQGYFVSLLRGFYAAHRAAIPYRRSDCR